MWSGDEGDSFPVGQRAEQRDAGKSEHGGGKKQKHELRSNLRQKHNTKKLVAKNTKSK